MNIMDFVIDVSQCHILNGHMENVDVSEDIDKYTVNVLKFNQKKKMEDAISQLVEMMNSGIPILQKIGIINVIMIMNNNQLKNAMINPPVTIMIANNPPKTHQNVKEQRNVIKLLRNVTKLQRNVIKLQRNVERKDVKLQHILMIC